jgi:hypothetical protein
VTGSLDSRDAAPYGTRHPKKEAAMIRISVLYPASDEISEVVA